MNLRLSLRGRPILTILVIAMLGVGLACAGEKATPTSPPTATTAPTATATTAPTATLVPTATATLVPGAPTPTATAIPTATATAVPTPTVDIAALPWAERLMLSPGYKPEWGTPQTGGILRDRVSRNASDFNPNDAGTTTGTFVQPPQNSLLRFDPWVGFTSILPDLAKSWEWSSDFLHLTMKLEEGVKFQDNPNVPAEYNGGRIRGDEFTCEDVQASVERHVRPPKWETKMNKGPAMFWNLRSVSCPDGPLGYTAVLNFDPPLAKTMAAVAQGLMVMLDKDWIEWYNAEHPAGLNKGTPESFLWGTGYGPFVPVEHKPDVMAKYRRNPNYWREGLPLIDGIDIYIIKDFTTAFTALATGQIDVFGRGSWSMMPGQVAQAERSFKDRIVIHPNLHLFGYGVGLNLWRAPFDDRRVRQAIQLAINRDDWLLMRRAGSLPGGRLMGAMAPRTPWSYTEEELRTWPGLRQPKDQDIAEANRLLDEVFGKGKRFSITCLASGEEYLEDCLFFQDQMKRALNITVAVETVEPAVGTERGERGQYDLTSGAVGARTDIGDPDDYLLTKIHRGYGMGSGDLLRANGAAAAEPVLWAELEALIDQETREMDPVKRKELVQNIEWKVFHEAALFVTHGWRMAFPGSTTKVKGYRLFDMSLYSNWSIWERVWLVR